MEGDVIDDPVRMYLREIGRVTLLTAADERRLALQRASYKHVEKAANDLRAETGRTPRDTDVAKLLLRRLHDQRELLDNITEFLAIEEEITLGELLHNEKLRANVDGELSLEMLETLAPATRWSPPSSASRSCNWRSTATCCRTTSSTPSARTSPSPTSRRSSRTRTSGRTWRATSSSSTGTSRKWKTSASRRSATSRKRTSASW